LLDTNLLLVFVVGSYDPAHVSMHKRTAEFTAADFYQLKEMMDEVRPWDWTTWELPLWYGDRNGPTIANGRNSFSSRTRTVHDQ
jgi:hypothetical protein